MIHFSRDPRIASDQAGVAGIAHLDHRTKALSRIPFANGALLMCQLCARDDTGNDSAAPCHTYSHFAAEAFAPFHTRWERLLSGRCAGHTWASLELGCIIILQICDG